MSNKKRFLGLLIPRPHSFMANSLIFGGGVLFALLEGYKGQEWNGRVAMPVWLFVLLWWLVQELLVQQAKYMLNDSRDRDRDQHIPANKIRPIASSHPSKTVPIVMGARWIAGVLLALWLSPAMLLVVLFISGLQVVYELWAKPFAEQHPKWPLFVVAAGTVLKFSGGALAIGWPTGDQRFWLYGIAFFATGVLYVSSFWRVEASYFGRLQLLLPRRQSAYYARTGMTWFTAGTAVTIAACSILIFDGYNNFLTGTDMGTAFVLTMIIVTGVVLLQLFFLFASTGIWIRYAAVALWVMACSVYLLFELESTFPFPRESVAAAILMLFLLINHGLNYNTDYRKQNLIYFANNWVDFKQTALSRPPQTSTTEHWGHLLQLILVLNTPQYVVLRAQQKEYEEGRQGVRDADSPFQNQEVLGGGRPN